MKVLILAGGGGTRLWPLSRQDFPKQFLSFDSSFSLLQKTVNRFLAASFVDEIVVTTNEQYQKLVELQLRKIDPQKTVQLLVEPTRRNTAAAIALGVKYFEEQAGISTDSVILVVPSDQLIDPESVFLRFLEEVEVFAKNSSRIIIFGIRPNQAEVGYGYIQIGTKQEGPLYSIKRFVEKPDRCRAEEYLAQGDYYWNAGICVFSSSTFWKQAKSHAPELFEKMQGTFSSCLEQFPSLPDKSIDYAILEKTKQISVCPLPISWSDIGSWDGVYEALNKDHNQNVKVGNILEIDTKNSLIIGGRRLISTIGLKDMLIVETDDAIFISKKGESQKVKELVQKLVQIKYQEISPSQQTETWGFAKQLYRDDAIQLTSYQIHAMTVFSYMLKVGAKVLWIVLKGMVEITWQGQTQRLSSLESIRLEQEGELKLENTATEQTEIMLLEFLETAAHTFI